MDAGHYKLQLQLALDLNKAEYVHTAVHKVCFLYPVELNNQTIK